MAEEKKDDDDAGPLAKAADRIRASAQSLLTAFAAVGALLAAGLQLGDIGDVSAENCARFVATFGGLALGVIGVVVAIGAAASVATKSSVSLGWLIDHPKSQATKTIDGDSTLRRDRDLSKLREELASASKEANETYDRIMAIGDPGNDQQKQAQQQHLNTRLTNLRARTDRLRKIESEILEVASFYRVKEAYDTAKIWMSIGAVLAAFGLAAFAWGSNAPDEAAIDPGELVPKTPSEVTVILSEDGASEHQDALGADCDTGAISAIAFSVKGETYQVTTLLTDTCASVQLEIPPEIGEVIPRVKDAEGGDGEEEEPTKE
jgi:hypothetical protein